MRISIVVPSLAGGGSERFAALLANGLSKSGHEVILMSGPIQNGEYEIDYGIKREVIFNESTLVRLAISLNKYNKKNHIKVCIAIGLYPNFLAAISKFYSSTYYILSERNAPNYDTISLKSRLLKYLLYWHCDAFVFQTPDAMLLYPKRIQEKGVVIPNPVKGDLPFYTGRQNKEIVAVGRLKAQKNYKLLLDAFSIVVSQYPEYKLRIFGKGEEEMYLKEYANSLGLTNRVFFEGFSNNVHRQIINSDIFVLSSDYEGMPNSLLEAMCMGFPVVSTDCPCGGPKVLIREKENGLLVAPKDMFALANAIMFYIKKPDLKNKCAYNARKLRHLYSIDKIVALWEDLLNETVLSRK